MSVGHSRDRHGLPAGGAAVSVWRLLKPVLLVRKAIMGAILSLALPYVALLVAAGMLFTVGTRLFGGTRSGAIAMATFLTTPLIWYAARSAPHALYPLPFVAGWLIAVANLQQRRDAWWWAAIAGGMLGLGVLTAPAAAVMMPLYLLMTLALAAFHRSLDLRQLLSMTAAFLAAASPALVMVIRDPNAFRQLVIAYRLYDAQRFNVLQGVREMTSWVGLTARSEVYYDFFNPAFLFLTTRGLLFPLAVLLPIGLWRLLTSETTVFARLSLLGFVAAPFAASLSAEAPTPGRILFLVPFATLVSMYGLRVLDDAWRRRSTSTRVT